MQFMLLIHGDESQMNALETDDTGMSPDTDRTLVRRASRRPRS